MPRSRAAKNGEIDGRNKNGEKTGPTGEEMFRGITECMANYDRDTRVFPYEMARMSIEDQSKYADYVTRSNVNEKWLTKQTHHDTDQSFMKLIKGGMLNSSSIGGLAYIALHCKTEKTSNRARHLLNLWVNHMRTEYRWASFVGSAIALGTGALTGVCIIAATKCMVYAYHMVF